MICTPRPLDGMRPTSGWYSDGPLAHVERVAGDDAGNAEGYLDRLWRLDAAHRNRSTLADSRSVQRDGGGLDLALGYGRLSCCLNRDFANGRRRFLGRWRIAHAEF